MPETDRVALLEEGCAKRAPHLRGHICIDAQQIAGVRASLCSWARCVASGCLDAHDGVAHHFQRAQQCPRDLAHAARVLQIADEVQPARRRGEDRGAWLEQARRWHVRRRAEHHRGVDPRHRILAEQALHRLMQPQASQRVADAVVHAA